ncbi:hypothetical protein [Flavobacterium aurantiibacter]|nr:hypothetical protein [Flavobacterium aurantiibacter]
MAFTGEILVIRYDGTTKTNKQTPIVSRLTNKISGTFKKTGATLT